MNEADIRKAWNLSLRYLSYRQRSKKEMELYLLRKGFENLTVETVLERLRERGFLNERVFALDWIDYSFRKGKGSRRIVLELREKGIDESIINESMDRLFSYESEYERALAIARKYLSAKKNKTDNKTMGRASAFLRRRGFNGEVVYKVLAECFEEDIF